MSRRCERGGAAVAVLVGLVVLAGVFAVLAFVPRINAEPTGDIKEGTAAPAKEQPRPDGTEPSAAVPPADSAEDPPEPSPAEEESPAGDEALWLDVDLSDQLVEAKQGNQTLRQMVTSSGAPGNETPLGTFQVQNRGEWFFSEKYQEGAKWWVSFKDWGIYLFHSVVMDRDQNVIPEEAAKLGTPASHGCLRLVEEDARWLYENVPEGSTVVIHA